MKTGEILEVNAGSIALLSSSVKTNERPEPETLHRSREGMVPVERIELPTFGLQNRCTTAVLHRLASCVLR